MRRKIAKRKRREILRRGAVITEEKWERMEGWRMPGKKREFSCFCTVAQYKGWKIAAPESDELASYKAIIEAMDLCDDEAWRLGDG